MAEQPDALSPQAALQRIAEASAKQVSIRSRFEGMAWILWGLVVALQTITFEHFRAYEAFGAASEHLVGLLAHAWALVGIAASVGIWRASAVHFDAGVARTHALAFFVGWPLAIAAAAYGLILLGAGGAVNFAGVTTLLLVAFALFNPVRFTRRGRWTAAALALVALSIAILSWANPETDRAIVGTLLGFTWVVAGLYALYQG